MWKSAIILLGLLGLCCAGVIHEEPHHQEYSEHSHGYEHHEPEPAETDHHHEVEHKHATSHQSFKMHHYHAVPVYIKKEDQHYVKNPVEIGKNNHKLKVLHPETEHKHGGGLVLENHSEVEDKTYHHHHEPEEHHHDFSGHDFGGSEDRADLQQYHGGEEQLSHHQFHDINVHHGEQHEHHE